ncbi:aminotransferase class V-fold PLP-dependent enzyme [Chlamydiales bacterium]|nr:aminotransferase class V-fold PLP-dependent enzyme [Chlamydiales bacterium]
MLYLDHASTSHPKPDAMIHGISEYLNTVGASPGRGSYSSANKGSDFISAARKELSALFHITNPNHLAFSSNATHSLNILLKGFLKEGDHVVICSHSHNAAFRPLKTLSKERGITFTVLPISKNGSVDLYLLETMLNKKTALILLNHASNVTGIITEIGPLSKMLDDKNIAFGLDVSQTAGYIPLNVNETPISFLAGTGHKTLMGPSGIGFFYAKDPLKVSLMLEGGSSGNASSSPNHPKSPPYRFEAGTLNYLGIAGLRASIKHCQKMGFSKMLKQGLEVTAYLINQLQKLPYITLYGSESASQKIPLISFNMHGITPSAVAHILDEEYAIAVRSGLHCAPNCHKTLGTYPTGTVRVSVGNHITKENMDYLINAIKKIQEK